MTGGRVRQGDDKNERRGGEGEERRDQKPRDQYHLYNYRQLPGLLGDQIEMREREREEEEEEDDEAQVENHFKVALIFIVFFFFCTPCV